MYLIIYAENGIEYHFVSMAWTPQDAIAELYDENKGFYSVDSGLFQRMASGLSTEDAARAFNSIADMHIERMFRLVNEVDIYGGTADADLQDNK